MEYDSCCNLLFELLLSKGAIDSYQYTASRKTLLGSELALSLTMMETREALGPVLSQGDKTLYAPVIEESLKLQAVSLYEALCAFNTTMSLLFIVLCATPWKK